MHLLKYAKFIFIKIEYIKQFKIKKLDTSYTTLVSAEGVTHHTQGAYYLSTLSKESIKNESQQGSILLQYIAVLFVELFQGSLS